MRTRYMGEKIMDLGEEIYICCIVKPVCDEDLPFEIVSAEFQLTRQGVSTPEAFGYCDINGHELKAFISPRLKGMYKLKFTYEIADEVWVDNFRVRVV